MIQQRSESIQKNAEAYRQGLVKIEQRRETWHERLKPMLESVLGFLVNDLELDLKTEHQSVVSNVESISLSFHDSGSGVDDAKTYTRVGPKLAFSILSNGMVKVWIRHGGIEYFEAPAEDQELAIVEPADIDEDEIISFVEQFFKIATRALDGTTQIEFNG